MAQRKETSEVAKIFVYAFIKRMEWTDIAC